MKLMQELLEDTKKRMTKKEEAAAREFISERAKVVESTKMRLAVLELMMKAEKARLTGAEKAIMPIMDQMEKANIILEGINVNVIAGKAGRRSTSYAKVADDLTDKLREHDKDADKVFEDIKDKYTAEAKVGASKLDVTSEVMESFLSDLKGVSADDALERVGSLEKYPELIRKAKARKAKKEKVEEGIVDDFKAWAKGFVGKMVEFAKGLLPDAKALPVSAKEIKKLASQIK